MKSVQQILHREISRCFRKAFDFRIDSTLKRSQADEEYDYVCELPEQILETFKSEMQQWGPSHLLFARDIGEEILVHLDKDSLNFQGINIIEKISLNDRGHIEIFLSEEILEQAINQYEGYFQKDESKNMIVLGPMLSLGRHLTLTQYRSICIANTLSRSLNSQHIIPLYQQNLAFCEELYEHLKTNDSQPPATRLNSENLRNFRDYLNLKEKHYVEAELLKLRLHDFGPKLDTRVVGHQNDILKQYESFERIIIVDEFKALQDFKENQKCVLWGHNQFGEEHQRFDSPLIHACSREIKLQVLKIEPHRPYAFGEQNFQENQLFLNQIHASIGAHQKCDAGSFKVRDQMDRLASRMIIQYPEVTEECHKVRGFSPLIAYWQRLSNLRPTNAHMKMVINRFHCHHLRMFNL